MAKTHPHHPPDFWPRLLDLVGSEGSPERVARRLDSSAATS